MSEIGDPLEKVASAVDWNIFRPILNAVFYKESKASGGRPPWDYVLMFKILLLQQRYMIADDNTEYLINDRLSFQRFLGLSLGDKVPDAKSIWLFRENLSKSGADREMFELFAKQLESQGVITRTGSLVDAPRQRNSREENEKIKGENCLRTEKTPNAVRKIRTRVGRRKTVKHIMDTRITLKLTRTAS